MEYVLPAQFHCRQGVEGSNPYSSTNANFGLAVGGGVDYKRGEHWAIRFVHLDYMMGQSFGAIENRVHLSTGVVFRWQPTFPPSPCPMFRSLPRTEVECARTMRLQPGSNLGVLPHSCPKTVLSDGRLPPSNWTKLSATGYLHGLARNPRL